MRAIGLMYEELDVRPLLSAVSMPTLVLYRAQDRLVRADLSRRSRAGSRARARLSLRVRTILFIAGDQDAMIDGIEQFITGRPLASVRDRMLATILFVDIVGSTDRAAELGDRRWRELLGQFARCSARCPRPPPTSTSPSPMPTRTALSDTRMRWSPPTRLG